MRILIKNQQKLRTLNKTRIKKVARKILSLLEQPTSELSILLVDDKEMQELNTIFRGIKKTTDVLSFPQLSAEEQKCRRQNSAKVKNFHNLTSGLLGFRTSELILGDVVINIHQADRQAKKHGVSFYAEIYYLLIHGILHLLGYKHEKGGYNASVMRRKEEEIFNAIKKIN